MSLVRRNVVANFAGQLWSALMGVVFIPVYIHLLGLEAFGLVAFYVTLQALSVVFDLGLSGTIRPGTGATGIGRVAIDSRFGENTRVDVLVARRRGRVARLVVFGAARQLLATVGRPRSGAHLHRTSALWARRSALSGRAPSTLPG
ncbi:MAG: hypothetical protein MZW92_08325 [Comamonadaceae bacterium]|nr:hypothetical protein [Comamonadaceae bacterium]